MVQENHHAKTFATLEQLMTHVCLTRPAPKSPRIEGGPERAEETAESGGNEELSKAVVDNPTPTTELRITTRLPLKTCDRTCLCQCHVRTHIRTPTWLSAAVGTLFYSSTHTPLVEVRPCNIKQCLRSQPSSSACFTYYFPTWFMRCAMVYGTWSKLGGANATWMIKMPREISETEICWYWIQRGSIQAVRDLLGRGQMSPYDINPEGVSVLHVSHPKAVLYLLSLQQILTDVVGNTYSGVGHMYFTSSRGSGLAFKR